MILTVNINVFCPTCEKEVLLQRKNFEHKYHEILCFLMITGVGFLIYLILKYAKKKDRCPNCDTKFDLKNLPNSAVLDEKKLNIEPKP